MQSTALNQPQIVASGVVETVNGVPAVYFGGSQNLNFSPSGLPSGSSSSSLVWVGSVSSLAGNGLIWYGNSATNQQRALSTYTSNGVFWVSDQGSNILNGTPTAGKPFIGTGLFGNSLLQGYFNGASTGSTAAALVTSLVYGQIGQNASIGGNQTGYAIEMMIVPALMSASDRAIYDVNVATFAGISGVTQ